MNHAGLSRWLAIFLAVPTAAQPLSERIRLPGPPALETFDWISQRLGWPTGPVPPVFEPESRLTYWHLDEDPFREAILVRSQGPTTQFLVFDQDREGWWFIGKSTQQNYTIPRFRVGNWPDPGGPRCVIVSGTWEHGSSIYTHGTSVFRVSGGRLVHLMSEQAWGSVSLTAPGGLVLAMSRSYVRRDPGRILTARRQITTRIPGLPSLRRFLEAPVVECWSRQLDPSAQAYEEPLEIAPSLCAAVVSPL